MAKLELLRPADVASRLGLTTNRVYQLISDGVIPSTRIGGAIRIPRPAWDTWLKRQSENALAAAECEGATEAPSECELGVADTEPLS